jgi:hypothetical protein
MPSGRIRSAQSTSAHAHFPRQRVINSGVVAIWVRMKPVRTPELHRGVRGHNLRSTPVEARHEKPSSEILLLKSSAISQSLVVSKDVF